MSKDDKLEAVRQKIIEACPDILELKFGCEIILDDKKEKKSIKAIVTDSKIFYKRGIDYDGKLFQTNIANVGLITRFRFYEVIGRKIGIADVLRGIHIATLRKAEKRFVIDTYGTFWRLGSTGKAYDWNFSQDDLNEQSEETIDFLYNILCSPIK